MRMILFVALTLAALSGSAAQAEILPAEAPVTSATRYIDLGLLGSHTHAGVPAYATKLDQLEKEFAPLEAEFEKLVKRADDLKTQYHKAVEAGEPAQAQKLQEEADKLNIDMRMRYENGAARYKARETELLGTITQRISEEADSFSRSKGMSDLRFLEPDVTAWFRNKGAQDVTADFAAWFSKRVP
jgi:Skp family chaperone for outer membrane proteins